MSCEGWVDLDSGLDNVYGRHGAVGDSIVIVNVVVQVLRVRDGRTRELRTYVAHNAPMENTIIVRMKFFCSWEGGRGTGMMMIGMKGVTTHLL